MSLRLDMLIPEIFLFGWALVVFTADLVVFKKNKAGLTYLTMVGFLAAVALVAVTPTGPLGFIFANDELAVFFKIVILLAGFMATASSYETVQKQVENAGEFFGLVLLSAVGMMFLVSATDLILLYVALELSTIPLFVLAAFQKRYIKSSEAGLKYLILGALSSALLLYGISFLYGLTGTTIMIAESINLLLKINQVQFGLILALVLVVAGLGFKLALVPFHMWAPDVYEGAPTPITSYLSVASKAAALAAFARFMYTVFTVGTATEHWGPLIAILAAAAMILGNIAAIRQTNIKRMLAYSSIAQAGYILVGFVSADALGVSSVAIYIFAYIFANMGAFAVVIAAEHKLGSARISDYGGMVRKSPWLAASLTIFLLSLAGIPPLAGFIAKYNVFMAAIQNGHYLWLVLIAVLTSVISIFYYARVIKEMFITETASEGGGWRLSFPLSLAILLGLIGTVVVGVIPQPFLSLAATVGRVFVY